MNLIVGSGIIAEEYIKVLRKINIKIEIVGNTPNKCENISNKYSINCYSGGLEKFQFKKDYNSIIITSPIKLLFDHLKIILEKTNINNIFVEKPGCLYTNELKEIIELKNKKNKQCNIYIGYNRRFYSSLLKCMDIVNTNKIKSAELEIDEYNIKNIKLGQPKEIMQNWFTAMTTHVVDMFFFIIGKPNEIETNFSNINLDWHNRSSHFSGNGISNKNIKFSYKGNWEKDGKWKIKLFLTDGKILEFQPLEDLKIIDNTEIKIINRDNNDTNFKPGFYKQIESFFGDKNNLKTIEEQYQDSINIYEKISNYQKKYDVLIVGLGNIGFRHLQAITNTKLNINLILVEISDNNIKICNDYLNEIGFDSFKFYKNINDIEIDNLDISIIATCSGIRLKLIENLFQNKKIQTIKNLILEKIIFTNSNDFKKLEDIIEGKLNKNNIYCSSNWFNIFYLDELSSKYDLTNSKVNICGKNWGLACNSIHAIICFLNIFDEFKFCPEDITIIDSKRDNYKELLGKFIDKNIILESSEDGDDCIKIIIETKIVKISITFNADSSYQVNVINSNNENIKNYPKKYFYLSESYSKEYKNILFNDKVNLSGYDISKKAHLILINTLRQIFKNYEKLPIT